MELGQIILIILGSIITFIGLVLNKIYDVYVKKNVVVQLAIYLFFTLLTLRLLYWIAKPFIHSIIMFIKQCLSHVNITFTADPSISISIVLLIFTLIIVGVIKTWINEIK